ncbi:hypothetical protein F7725_002402 [Dissostichus mawsoni]|uniref:Uncharacterized protein n=1 Tax=Dissostichus mawsoni TaxID=36200 RepID=A0A7J5Y398_DISMA|nr:hypothetical protein F7725_002402 [Dissostichus mawsoni]
MKLKNSLEAYLDSPIELSSHEARAVVDHEHAALHPDGAALLEPGVQVGAVAHALMVLASKVPVLLGFSYSTQQPLSTLMELQRLKWGCMSGQSVSHSWERPWKFLSS